MILEDKFSRQFQYVRLSLTERCNFKCQYCLPNGYQGSCAENPLSITEINNLVAALVELGVWKIRLTGGEPTLRRDLTEIIQTIKSYPQIREIALTTNAYKLNDHIQEYHAAGLTNLNISLDSLNREQFQMITGVDKLAYVKQSIHTATELGIDKIKINAVLLKANYLNELELFLEFIQHSPYTVRFIELMRTTDNGEYFNENYLAASVLQQWLVEHGWSEQTRISGAGPAVEYQHSDYMGKIGVIAPYSQNFCANCNRLRITHTGDLRLCLFGGENYSLRDLLQTSEDKDKLKQAILSALTTKPKAHKLVELKTGNINNLSNVGG